MNRQTPPARSATPPIDQPRPGAPTTPQANLDVGARTPPATPLIADADSLRARLTPTRLCILCGRPLRVGQHMLRVHGSTIHARCGSSQ